MEASYYLTLPGDEMFDVEREGEMLLANPCVFRHPNHPLPTYIVVADPSLVPFARARLEAEPGAPYDTLGVIQLRPEYVTVYQMCPRPILDEIARYVIPLIRDRGCRVTNEYDVDRTEAYREHPERLFVDV